MDGQEIRLFLVTSSPVIEQFIKQLAVPEHGLTLMGAASEGELLLDGSPAVELADAAVIDASRIAAAVASCRAIKSLRVALPLVALVYSTRDVTTWHINALMDGTLNGLVDLQQKSEDVAGIVRSATNGRVAILIEHDPERWMTLRNLLPNGQQRPIAPTMELSSREREVLQCLVDGVQTKAIAARLGISTSTVANHVSNIEKKLGAQNRVQVGMIAARIGLLSE